MERFFGVTCSVENGTQTPIRLCELEFKGWVWILSSQLFASADGLLLSLNNFLNVFVGTGAGVSLVSGRNNEILGTS